MKSRGNAVRRLYLLLAAACLALVIILAGGGYRVYAAKPKLNKTYICLKKGKKATLRVLNNSRKVTWKSSNKSVAKVSKSGKVTAKKDGKASITASIRGGKKLKCSVYVGYYQWLRANVLASKKTKDGWNYVKKRVELNEEGGYAEYTISAKHGTNEIRFEYFVYYVEPDETIKVSMSLISQKDLTARGQEWHDDYGSETSCDFELTKASYNKDVLYVGDETSKPAQGITYSKYFCDGEEESTASDKTWFENSAKPWVEGYAQQDINRAFENWEKMLKKYKITWKKLGFKKR